MTDHLPTSVCYVKNGRGGKWWPAAKANGQVHAGWRIIPPEQLQNPGDFKEIERIIRKDFDDRGAGKGAATNDFQALKYLLEAPSQHVWITFEDGCMWWCTVRDGAVINPNREDNDKGNFWLVCDRQWSNLSLNERRLLAIPDLPGIVTRVSGFRGTVSGEPPASAQIRRVIRDEKDPDATQAASARSTYQQAIENVVKRLSPQDFEKLIDLILYRTGWSRISTLGGTAEGIDLEAENLAADEIAFVQVKSTAKQANLDEYVRKFSARSERYKRMIFAVHSPEGRLIAPENLPVQVWTGNTLTQFVVRLGLGEWVEKQLA